MSAKEPFMVRSLFGTVRRNHALEHATITVLLRKLGRDVRMVGRATGDGYFLYADLPTPLVEESTREALARLKNGEGHLAVTPLCGTNIAVAGAMTALAATLALGSGPNRTQRLPNAIVASMFAVVAAQPVGRLVQRFLTTSPDLDDTEIVDIRAGGRGAAKFHKVLTRRSPAL
jgi:hypothetical protein